MVQFLNGVAVAGAFAVGLFFVRWWRETGDRFYALFGAAFWILSASWLALAWAAPEGEHRHYWYVPRLFAFLLIIAAIVDKNRSTSGTAR
jgi:hypothetical protein